MALKVNERCTYIRHFLLDGAVEDIPKHIDRCARLDSDTGLHTFAVNEPDQFLGRSLLIRLALGTVGGGGRYGGLIMEAVEIAARFLEVAHPPLRLCDHHVAVKSSFTMSIGGTVYVWPDLGNDGCSKRHVWHEVAVHDVDLEA